MDQNTKNELYFLIIRCQAMAELLNCLGLGSEKVLGAMDFEGKIDGLISQTGLSIQRDLSFLLDTLQKYRVL